MKELYDVPVIELVRFDTEDVITTSVDVPRDDNETPILPLDDASEETVY